MSALHPFQSVGNNLLLMVQKVMGHVIESVSEYATTESSSCCVPVPEDEGMCEFPERRGKYDKECRWHDKSVLVHGKVVVNAMKEKM
jgi:hypothetical protein